MTTTPDRIEHLPIDSLIPYARNSRTHSPEQVAQIAASIQEFGFTNPVLIDAAGGLIAGNGRVMGARQLGLATIPCIRLAHLTDVQKRAYVIADNQIALNSGWDDDLLAQELSSLMSEEIDLQVLGFDVDMESLIADLSGPGMFQKSMHNHDRHADEEGEPQESRNLKRYPVTVILDEKEFEEWEGVRGRLGYSDKKLMLELLRSKK